MTESVIRDLIKRIRWPSVRKFGPMTKSTFECCSADEQQRWVGNMDDRDLTMVTQVVFLCASTPWSTMFPQRTFAQRVRKCRKQEQEAEASKTLSAHAPASAQTNLVRGKWKSGAKGGKVGQSAHGCRTGGSTTHARTPRSCRSCR